MALSGWAWRREGMAEGEGQAFTPGPQRGLKCEPGAKNLYKRKMRKKKIPRITKELCVFTANNFLPFRLYRS